MSTYLVKVSNKVGTWNYVAKGKTLDDALGHYRECYYTQPLEKVLGVNYITESEDYEQVLDFAKQRMEDTCLEVRNLISAIEGLVVKIDSSTSKKEYGIVTGQGYEIREILTSAREKLDKIDESIHLIHGFTEE